MSDAEYTDFCHICGEEHDTEDLEYVESIDDVVCESCLDESFFECEECGELFHEDVMCGIPYGNHTDEKYCESCIDDITTTCDQCGDTYHINDITYFEFYDGSAQDICVDCDDEVHTCYRCGLSVWSDDVICDDYGDCYCPDCYTGDGENTSEYYDNPHYGTPPQRGKRWSDYYSWTPGEPETNMLYGIELEIDVNTHGVPDVNPTEVSDLVGSRFFPEVYQVSDGSLTDYGIEFISNPCSLEYHKTAHPWNEILKIARTNHYYSHDAIRSCGLHIHVNRGLLTNREIHILVFIYEWFSDKMEVISRRNINSLNAFSACMLESSHFGGRDEFRKQIINGDYKISDIHYKSESANSKMWMCNAKPGTTLEIRLFNGTTRFDRLIQSIAFVDMTVMFSKKLAALELPFTDSLDNNLYENDKKLIEIEWRDLLLFAKNEYPDPTPLNYIQEKFGDMMGLDHTIDDDIDFIRENFGL